MGEKATTGIYAVYDISGIQDFIFSSAKLKENIGGSKIVGDLFKVTLGESIRQVMPEARTEWNEYKDFEICSDSAIKCEVVYIGGGNAHVVFRDAKDFHQVNEVFAKRVFEESHCLNIAVAAIETDFSDFMEDRKQLITRLSQTKSSMVRQLPVGAPAICKRDAQSMLPIIVRKNEAKKAAETEKRSRDRCLKLEAAEKAVKEIEKNEQEDSLAEPVELSMLTPEKGVNGFIGVVHIDGNNMGVTINELMNAVPGNDYSAAVQEMRRISGVISKSFEDVLDEMTQHLQQLYHKLEGDRSSEEEKLFRRLFLKEGELVLPMRTLIADGDDITFVANGSIAIQLAAWFVQKIADKALDEENEKPFSACAGVALVKDHFPFSIAYEMAEACCASAKKKCKAAAKPSKDAANQAGEKNTAVHGYIDWHICHSAYIRDIETLRRDLSPYQEKPLFKRPYCVEGPEATEGYHKLTDIVMALRSNAAFPISRQKDLRSAYMQGPDAVKMLLEQFKSRDVGITRIKAISELADTGYDSDGRSILYDAMELSDYYDDIFEKWFEGGVSCAEG